MDHLDAYQAWKSCNEESEHGRPWRNEVGWETSGGSGWTENGVRRLLKTVVRT